MSAPPAASGAPITGRRQLIEYLAGGEKPPAKWRIGTEHEKFAFRLEDLRPLPYDGERASIRGLLEGLTRFWGTLANGHVKRKEPHTDDGNITNEPSRQFALASAPHNTI